MLWCPGTQSGSTAEAEANSLEAETLQMVLWGPRACPGQKVLQPREPHITAPRRDPMQWLNMEVAGGSELVLVYCRQKTPGSKNQLHGAICSPVQERCAGLGDPPEPPAKPAPISDMPLLRARHVERSWLKHSLQGELLV